MTSHSTPALSAAAMWSSGSSLHGKSSSIYSEAAGGSGRIMLILARKSLSSLAPTSFDAVLPPRFSSFHREFFSSPFFTNQFHLLLVPNALFSTAVSDLFVCWVELVLIDTRSIMSILTTTVNLQVVKDLGRTWSRPMHPSAKSRWSSSTKRLLSFSGMSGAPFVSEILSLYSYLNGKLVH